MSSYTQKDPKREEDRTAGHAYDKMSNRNAVLENPVKKDTKSPSFRTLVILSKKLSLRQFDPSEETHREAIERTLLRSGYPRTQFLYEFGMETERLLDSKRFETDCQNRNLDPRVVAQHVVFAGDKFIRAVIARGLVAALGSSIVSMTKPIFEVSEIEFILRKQSGLLTGCDSNCEVTVEQKSA